MAPRGRRTRSRAPRTSPAGTAGDTLTGDAAQNDLRGGSGTGADTLSGGDADDNLFGGTGANPGADGTDVYVGGGHVVGDRVHYDGRSAGLVATVGGAGPDGETLNAGIESIVGGEGDDTLTGDAANNQLSRSRRRRHPRRRCRRRTRRRRHPPGQRRSGGHGHVRNPVDRHYRSLDTGGPETDSYNGTENLTGGSGDDTLSGDDEDNTLEGGAGDDVLAGGTGATGSDGSDTFIGGDNALLVPVGDFVTYAGRTDGVFARIGSTLNTDGDDIRSDVENLTGGNGNDFLTGNSDANQLRGGDNGSDTLAGGAGTGPDGADNFRVGAGTATNIDTVTYANRADDIDADLDDLPDAGAPGEGDDISSDADNLVGGSGADLLTGDDDANRLTGGTGTDQLFGLAAGRRPRRSRRRSRQRRLRNERDIRSRRHRPGRPGPRRGPCVCQLRHLRPGPDHAGDEKAPQEDDEAPGEVRLQLADRRDPVRVPPRRARSGQARPPRRQLRALHLAARGHRAQPRSPHDGDPRDRR